MNSVERTGIVDVSVMTPCRNEVRHIEAFLASLEALAREDLSVEFIVADGMSDDGTRDLLEKWSRAEEGRRVIDNPGKIVSTGLNAAIREAKGEFIIRMDAHTVYDRNYIVACVRALRSTGAKCVGGPWKAKGYDFISRCVADAFQSPLGSGNSSSRKTTYSGEVDTVYLGAWRKADLVAIGGFDEELVRNQDEELCFRFRLAGGKIWQDAGIKSTYAPRNTYGKLMRQSYQYGYWKVKVTRKHARPANLRQFGPAGLVAAGTILALLGFVVPVSWWVLSGLAVLYALICIVAYAGNGRSVRQTLGTALCIPCMHVGYGIGFWAGVRDFVLLNRGSRQSARNLTR